MLDEEDVVRDLLQALLEVSGKDRESPRSRWLSLDHAAVRTGASCSI
jgi:hypothetical protein